jgi:radical SAM protein with 4Fe4S-binding SPASM domain
MRARYESFGGIIALDNPAATLYVDRAFMTTLGYNGSPLWDSEKPALSAPVTAHYAITSRCSLGCKTCYNSSGPATSDELSTAAARRALDVLARMQVFTVAFGGGEPLTRPDVFALARHARRRGITPTLTTNGHAVDGKIARHCRVFSHIHVSLDGVGDTYRAVRGVDGFQSAARATELLTRSGISVGVNCVVCRPNFDHLEELIRFILALGVRDVIFLRLKPGGRAGSSYEAMRLTPDQRRTLYPRLRELTLRHGLHTHVDCAMMPFVYWHHPDRKQLRLLGAQGCVGGDEIVEIQPDGQVRACSFASESAGSVFNLPESWPIEPAFERFRHWAAAAPEPCRSCAYLALCRGGCHAVTRALTGDSSAADPECPFVSD